MKKRIYSFLYLLSFTFYLSQGFAQPIVSPNVKCVSVAANGDVTLTWATPANTGTFVDYKIYSSPNTPTAFAPVGTVTVFAQNTFIYTGAGANTKRVYYLVQTEYSNPSGISAPADTFSTIFLKVTDPFSTGNVTLNWNKISFHTITTSSGWYKIYRQYPIGIWTLHDSTQSISYTDKFHLCNDTISYRIEIDDKSSCSSVSNVAGKTLKDNSPPTLAPIDTVSVDTSVIPNRATISWDQSPSPDADSVVIYKYSGSSWFPIDTVPVLPAYYTYTLSTAGNNSEIYSIAFLDSCRNISPIGDEHQTIYLSASFDPCAGTASLVWNQYINMIPAVNQYEVLVSVNGGAFNVIATTSGITYTDTGLVIGTSYCYIIRATNNGPKTSSSNKTCFTPNVANPPAFTYNRFATVTSDKSIVVTGYVDTAPSITHFRIERAAGSNGVFSMLVDNIPKPPGNAISYTDNKVNTQSESYSYKWEAMNSCSKALMTSNHGTSIFLKASNAPDVDIALSWNDYGDWLGGVDHYEIYRAVDGVWDASPIASVPYTASGGTYTDDVAPFCTNRGIFSYYVIAIEGNGNPYAFKDSSKSNVATVNEYPKIYMPNTFTPNGDGHNDIFIPVICFINPSEYSLRIYDNTGTPVIISDNPAIGWDGKKRGHNCPEGVYMYVINCIASNGDNSQVSGTVSLIR